MDRDLSTSRAILIGNAAFRENPRIPDLPAATRCVTAMAELLTGELCGWPPERVVKLMDVSAPHDLARQVHAAVREVEGVLLMYYVGHGLRTKDGQLALALGETDPDPEVLPDTGMLYARLADILRGCAAATKLVILDCCYAELGNKAGYLFQSADLTEAYPVEGLYFIGASGRYKTAIAPLDGPLTYFTDAFVKVVCDGIPGGPQTLRLDQIFRVLRARLARAGLPVPVESGMGGAYQFPFARNAAPSDAPPSEFLTLIGDAAGDAEEFTPVRLPRRKVLSVAGGVVLTAGAGGAAAWMLTRPKKAVSQPGDGRAKQDPTVTQQTGTTSPQTGLQISTTTQPTGATTPEGSGLAQPLIGHNGLVFCVAFSPDGRTLASSSSDATVLLWDVTDPARPGPVGKPLTGHTNFVYSVAFSSDRRTLASSSGDSTVRLWNVADPTRPGALGQPLTGHTDLVTSVAFSPDGRTLASSGSDATVLLWDVTDPANPVLLGQPLSGPAPFPSVAFSPNGHILAGSCADRRVHLWDVTDRVHPSPLARPLSGHTERVDSVAFSPDGRTLASSSYDATIRLWNMADPAYPVLLGQPLSGPGPFPSVAFSPVGPTLAAANYSNTDAWIRLWNLADPAKPAVLGQPLTCLTGGVDWVAFTPDGHTLAAAGVDQWIRLWNTADPGKPVALSSCTS